MMVFDNQLFDELTLQAKKSPRMRMNYDLRSSENEESQRMLNAIEPGTKIPVHRHRKTNEVVVILRGKAKQIIYDNEGRILKTYIITPNGEMTGLSIPVGTWHTIESLMSGTIIMECKGGRYEPFSKEDVLS